MPLPLFRPPARLGRYRITARLGAGGFGVVYRGYDDELRRDVAIKVPHRCRLATAMDAEAYLAVARILASLDHPAIVPVHDVGRTDDGLCYLVSKYVECCDLAHRLQQGRPSLVEAVEIVARVAEALHHAHQRGLVHCLVNFVVRPGRLQKNGLGSFVLNEREDDPQVVADAAGPGVCQLSLQLVGSQRGWKVSSASAASVACRDAAASGCRFISRRAARTKAADCRSTRLTP